MLASVSSVENVQTSVAVVIRRRWLLLAWGIGSGWNSGPSRNGSQQVLFPEGLKFDGERFGTAVTCLAFKQMPGIGDGKSSLASPRGKADVIATYSGVEDGSRYLLTTELLPEPRREADELPPDDKRDSADGDPRRNVVRVHGCLLTSLRA